MSNIRLDIEKKKISKLENISIIIISHEKQRGKTGKNKVSISEIWGKSNRSNVCMIRVNENRKESREKG